MRAKGGSIVNMGSICGIQSLPNIVAYGAAKGGLLSLTRTLAGALSDDRIRVNYVIPGWVLSEGELTGGTVNSSSPAFTPDPVATAGRAKLPLTAPSSSCHSTVARPSASSEKCET